MAKRLTPQQKKELSYEHDRRNCYGENAKASRRLIPKKKAWARREVRHAAAQELRVAVRAADAEQADEFEAKVLSVKRPRWRKSPDLELGKHVERQLDRRAQPPRERMWLESRRREDEEWERFRAGYAPQRRKLLEALTRERSAFAESLRKERRDFLKRIQAERRAFERELEAVPAERARVRRLRRLAEESAHHRAFRTAVDGRLRAFDKDEDARIRTYRLQREADWREWRRAQGLPPVEPSWRAV